MKEVGLRTKTWCRWVERRDRLRRGRRYAAGIVPQSLHAAAHRNPSRKGIGGVDSQERVSFAEEGLIGQVRIRADAVERHARKVATPCIDMGHKAVLYIERKRPRCKWIVSKPKLKLLHGKPSNGPK